MTDAMLSLKIESGYSIFFLFFSELLLLMLAFLPCLLTYFIYFMMMTDMLLPLRIEDDCSIFFLSLLTVAIIVLHHDEDPP